MDNVIFTILFVPWVLAVILLIHHVYLQFFTPPPPPPNVPPYVRIVGSILSTAPALFLQSKIPTDTHLNPLEDANLPDEEKWLLHHKSEWITTEYPQQVADLVARIIADRKGQPITNAVCLGIAGVGPRDMQQFVVFSQIVTQLATPHPGLLDNIFIQDPRMMPEMRALFENHGCQVVVDPTGFERIGAEGANTFFFSPFVSTCDIAPQLRSRPYRDLAMFLGDGDSMLQDAKDFASQDPPFYREVIEGMLDLEGCKRELLPCDRPNGRLYGDKGPMQGLQSFEIWWRPVKKAQND